MTAAAFLLAIALPLVLAPLAAVRPLRGVVASAVPLAPVPALLLALASLAGFAEDRVEVPWLLLGVVLAVDATARVFLLFTAFLWAAAGLYARSDLAADPTSHRFFGFHLATLAGNLGLILAQDVVSFYLFFALMTFAAYALVVHDGTPEARRAGAVYLVLAIAGEMLLLSGLFLGVGIAGTISLDRFREVVAASTLQGPIVGLLLTGFGVKAGAILLHMWLPVAHPVAPTPASAVLSGAMIKAGLLGWLRFLPLGQTAIPEWGLVGVTAGVAAAYYGVLVGLTQRDAKTILAYSSVSQMGHITIVLGVGLAVPDAWPALAPVVALYALHHGLAKGALFLGVGVVHATPTRRVPAMVVLLLVPALALAGAPLTSGAAAKLSLKGALGVAGAPWDPALTVPLSVAAAGTMLLMLRFLVVVRAEAGEAETWSGGLVVPWLLTLLAVIPIAWLLVPDRDLLRYSLTPYVLWETAWPLLAAALLAAGAARWLRVTPPSIPPGDVLVVLEPLARSAGLAAIAAAHRTRTHVIAAAAGPAALVGRLAARSARLERRLDAWSTTGPVLLIVLAGLLALLALS